MPPTYWQIFSGDRIKPKHRGDLVYMLELPGAAGVPILRDVFDHQGEQYPPGSGDRIVALMELGYHGIVFDGLNREAVDSLMAWQPKMRSDDLSFHLYNQCLIWNSMTFLLCEPEHGLGHLPEALAAGLGFVEPGCSRS